MIPYFKIFKVMILMVSHYFVQCIYRNGLLISVMPLPQEGSNNSAYLLEDVSSLSEEQLFLERLEFYRKHVETRKRKP